MDKPPEQGAKIIDLFPNRGRPPKRKRPQEQLGAKVVKFSSIRSRSDEAPDISSDHIQDAQIIEIPDIPSKVRQEVSKLINDTIAQEFKRREGDDPQNYKEIAEKIVELLDEAYKRPDDKPRDNSTKELGACILALTVLNPEIIEVLNTPNVLAELERIIGLSRRPAHLDRQAASMAEIAWQQLTYKSEDTDDNADPEPPSIT